MSGSQSENEVPGWMLGALGTGLAGAAGATGYLAYDALRDRAARSAINTASTTTPPSSGSWFSSLFGDSALRDRIAGASRAPGGAGAGGTFGQAAPPVPPRPDFVVDTDGVARRPRVAQGPAFAQPGQAGLNAGQEAAQVVRSAAANAPTLGSTLRGAASRVVHSPITQGAVRWGGRAGLVAGTASGLMDAFDEQSMMRRAIDQGRNEAAQRWNEGSPIAAATTLGAGIAQGGLHAANTVLALPILSMCGAGRVADIVDRGIAQIGPGRNAPPLPVAAAGGNPTSPGQTPAAETPTYHGRNLPFATAPRSAPGPNGEWNGPSDQDMLRVHNERMAQRAQADSLMVLSPQQRGQLELARQMASIPRPRQASGQDMAIAQALTMIEQDFQRQLAAATTPQDRERVARQRISRILGVARGPGMMPMSNMYGPEIE